MQEQRNFRFEDLKFEIATKDTIDGAFVDFRSDTLVGPGWAGF